MSTGTKIRLLFFLLGICCLFTAISLRRSVSPQSLLNYQSTQLQQRLQAKEKLVYDVLANPSQLKQLHALVNNNSLALDEIKKYREKGVDLFVYKNQQLQFWSTSHVFPKDIEHYNEGSSFVQFPNGYFLMVKKTQGPSVFVFLILVKTQYSIQNRFLVNQISPALFSGKNLQLATFADRNTKGVFNLQNQYLFSVKLTADYSENIYTSLHTWLWAIGFFFIIACVNSFCSWLAKRGRLVLATSCLALFFIAFRLSDLKFLWFSRQFEISLFSPSVYAESDFLPSLGALLLNVVCITWLMLFIFIRRKQYQLPKKIAASKLFGFCITLAFLLAMVFISSLFADIFAGIIYNSKIDLDILNLIGLSWLSWISIFILCLVWLNIYLLTEFFLALSQTLNIDNKRQNILIVLVLIGVLISKIYANFDIYFLMFAFLLLLIRYDHTKRPKKASIGFLALLFCAMAFISGLKYLRFKEIKEHIVRTTIAEKLLYSDDPKVINALGSLEKSLQTDANIENYFKQPLLTQTFNFHNYLIKRYLDGYLSRFEYKIYEYNPHDSSLKSGEYVSIGKYRNLVQFGAVKSSETSFFYRINDTFGFQCYFGIIPIVQGKNKLGTLIIELKSLPFDYNNRFPELLIDGKLSGEEPLKDYSFAFYKNNVLYNQLGTYNYPLYNMGRFSSPLESITFFSESNDLQIDKTPTYTHAVYKPTPSKVIVVSLLKVSLVNRLIAISFFFLVFVILGIVFNALLWLIKNLNTNRGGWFGIHRYLIINANKILYKTRVQASIVLAVMATLLIVGWATFFNIKEDYRQKQEDYTRNKIRKIKILYEGLFSNRALISKDDDFISEFNQFADINDAYLNLYDVSGTLYLTSLPKMYDSGITGQKMNPQAYFYLKQQQQSAYLNPIEKFGSFVYAAAYVPIRNAQNETIAYMGMPYYNNEGDYQDKIGLFINTLINIYALVFVLIGAFAVFLANQITSPLSFIQESIKKTKLGKRNEPIYWHRQDEIGALVKEYNKMISELEDSANKLAKSERESAWREMAKQVAHEIKNPLTPLKLGVQLLEKAWKEQDAHFETKFAKFSKSFLEQIESLSAIASEFSNFAKMPDTNLAEVELLPILHKAIAVFNNFENIEMVMLNETNQPFIVLGDKDQLLRAFNNLFKNAIEASEAQTQSLIKIVIKNDDKNVYIDITDSGKGIDKSLQNKIFVPNFTTKSSGTGLGLAIAKQALENAQGQIRFKSEKNVGTTFYLSIPYLVK